MAPDFVRRSVAAHEIAHLVHFDHGPGFQRRQSLGKQRRNDPRQHVTRSAGRHAAVARRIGVCRLAVGDDRLAPLQQDDHAVLLGEGFGDVAPVGPIRFMAGTMALTGFVMITWSASFTYLEMARFWRK